MKWIQDFSHSFGGMVLHFSHQIALVALIGVIASSCRTRDFIKIWIVHWGVTVSFVSHQNGTFTLKGGVVTFNTMDQQDTDQKQNRNVTHNVNHNNPNYN